jgi:hypothetical protein
VQSGKSRIPSPPPGGIFKIATIADIMPRIKRVTIEASAEDFMAKAGSFAAWAGGTAIMLLAIVGCNFPYTPRKQPFPDTEPVTKSSDTGSINGGRLYHVNTGRQTCNPSVSPGGAYAACMLWLGFDGISVHVPDGFEAYSVTDVKEHDRLTITDTANTVRWYLLLTDVNRNGEFQCPEWSTHPDYLACLLGTITEPYSGYAVRLSDKKSLIICNRRLEEFSTPHLWVPDSAVRGGMVNEPVFDDNGLIAKAQVLQFFGTAQVKFIYTLLQRGGILYYVDYSAPGDPVPVPLKKPQGLENWYCHSPLISPDGGWVTYHCFPNSAQGAYYRSFIQKLAPDAQPIPVAEKASDPHWWADRSTGRYYIVYTITNGSYFSEYDYSDESIASSGNAGATMMQRLKGTWMDVPAFLDELAPDETYQPYTLVSLPFKGGLSRDGHVLCTAYEYAYIMKLF